MGGAYIAHFAMYATLKIAHMAKSGHVCATQPPSQINCKAGLGNEAPDHRSTISTASARSINPPIRIVSMWQGATKGFLVQ
jgi:hypothetical protein